MTRDVPPQMPAAVVLAVAQDATHRFSKQQHKDIRLVAGRGVEGDAHSGKTVQHRSRVAVDPSRPNLRQIHLIGAELLDEMNTAGFTVQPGEMGENITLRGIDLLALPCGTVLRFGTEAEIRITGLRNPCAQIETFRPGLLAMVLQRGSKGELVRRAGVMGIVTLGGLVRRGDPVVAVLPPQPHSALVPV